MLLVSFLLVACTTVGGTVALLMTSAGPITNTFLPSEVTTAVSEDIKTDTTTKKDVKIQNTGDIPAWIRAAVVVTWQNSQGQVYGKAPVAGTDYTIDWGDEGWTKGVDGYYYYTSPVAAKDNVGDETKNLIDSCTVAASATIPSGYNLTVEVIASGIQSVPATTVVDAWNSGVSEATSTTLTIKTSNQSGGEGQ